MSLRLQFGLPPWVQEGHCLFPLFFSKDFFRKLWSKTFPLLGFQKLAIFPTHELFPRSDWCMTAVRNIPLLFAFILFPISASLNIFSSRAALTFSHFFNFFSYHFSGCIGICPALFFCGWRSWTPHYVTRLFRPVLQMEDRIFFFFVTPPVNKPSSIPSSACFFSPKNDPFRTTCPFRSSNRIPRVSPFPFIRDRGCLFTSLQLSML